MTWRLFALLLLGEAPALQPVGRTWHTTQGADGFELKFTDKAGVHVVRSLLAPETTKTGKDDSIIRGRVLNVTHTLADKELWKAKDFVENCEFDLTLEPLQASFKVTDLDGDGVPEISFIYKLGCRSDVSPLTAKFLMYEGTTKYALRGQTQERVGENEFAGGDFKADPSFKQAPTSFLDFAKAQWNAFVLQPSSP